MFKILHFRGGEWMIAIGLTVEAILFCLLGFAAMSDKNDTVDTPAGTPATAELEKMLGTSIEAQTLERLRKGFDQFTKTVESVNLVAGSAQTTANMLTEMEQATKDLQAFRKHLAQLNTVYAQTVDSINQVAASSQTTKNMLAETENATKEMQSFRKNLTELNAVYTKQLEAFRKN
jgi:DNA repair ATPase RecN